MKQSDDPTVIQIAGRRVTDRVVSNIQAASKNTGVSFSYLMAQAGKESSFEAEAGSHASSAKGLFQFTKGTWLQLIKAHGAAHGLGDVASHIHRTAKGEYTVGDHKLRQEILDMRRDPQLAALMAGEYAKDNKVWLEKTLGRPVDSTDLYMAHFLGPGGAAKVLKAKAHNPSQPAAELLPQAARLNQSVFYDHSHTPRSVAAVYEKIHHAIERPMKQYAQLEDPAAAEAVGAPSKHQKPTHHHHANHHHQVASAPDMPWPFETGQWPPTYVPQANAPTATAPTPAAGTEQVAYTNASQSADQITSPMPPRTAQPGSPDGLEMKSPLGQLLKNLFG